MKSKVKKGLSRDVQILGKSVPVVAIAALFLIGSGSAAVLSSFGSVQGTTNVDQAITINGNSSASGSPLGQSYGFSGMVAGQTTDQINTVTNNLDTEAKVNFTSTALSTPGDANNQNVNSAQAYDAYHAVIENGETFNVTEKAVAGGYPVADTTSAETSYVSLDNKAGIKASYFSDGGHVHSGIWLETEEMPADEVNISANTVSSYDWLYVVFEYDGTAYLAGDFRSPESYAPENNTQYLYNLTESNIENIEHRSDFNKSSLSTTLEDVTDDTNAEWSNSTVHYAVAGTGSSDPAGTGETGSITYTGFQVNGEERLHSIDFSNEENVTLPSGNSELGSVFEFDLSAYPGNYEFELSVEPWNN